LSAIFALICTQALTPIAPSHLAATLLALLAVLVLIIILAWLLKRLSGKALQGQDQIKMITHLNLGQRERLLVIEVGNQHLLLGITSQQIRCLHVLPEPLLISGASSVQVFPKFAHFMRQKSAKKMDKMA